MNASLPDWLRPVADAAGRITADDLTRFVPPQDADPRRGAVLMLFGEGEHGPDLLLTERSHTMRSHPGQVSFPGGSLDPGETATQAALREAWEEIALEPASVDVFGRLPELWLPPSNFAVTPVLGWWRTPSPITVASPEEVHAIHRVPLQELREAEHRISVRHPSGWVGPGYLIGEQHDVVLWGFTAGIIARLFDFLGWSADEDGQPPLHPLPDYMLVSDPTREDLSPTRPNTSFLGRDWERGDR